MKRLISAVISFVLAFTFLAQPHVAYSSTITGKTYVKDVILSYGETDDEAKQWLKNKGYKVLDNNLNEGADATLSTKRAVYLGYKTTSDASEAITDMKVMNMQGGYSIEDYNVILEEQKTKITAFIDNFLVAIKEYRENYKKGQQRAITANELLNLLYDDDTEGYMGDLLLNKVKEEYSQEEFDALSKKEQNKIADLTTILMQCNGTAMVAMEQIIAMATDDQDSLWTERYQEAKTYDEMVEELMDEEDLTMSQAVKQLSGEYDSGAKIIASGLEEYREYLETYTQAEAQFDSEKEELEAFEKSNEDSIAQWLAAGTQYETLKLLENDDVALSELLTSDDYDLENEDRYMLYPLVASLTEGQRACLELLSMQQVVNLGINDDAATKEAEKMIDVSSLNGDAVSIYEGIDRSIFSDSVALTSEAQRLQSSTDKDAMEYWTDSISETTKVLYVAAGLSLATTLAVWGLKKAIVCSRFETSKAMAFFEVTQSPATNEVDDVINAATGAMDDAIENIDDLNKIYDSSLIADYQPLASTESLANTLRMIGIAATCITLALAVASLWSTYEDLQEYYHVDFSPIPMHMVNQGVDETDEKVFTYYTAAKCNREEAQLVTKKTKAMGSYGDLNGDVGKQWLALYTTKDAAAGDPIVADFKVQYGSSDVPKDSTALSLFGEKSALNLTNAKAGYTYSDDKNGTYLFYGTDTNAYVGSVFSHGTYALVCGCCIIIFAILSHFVGKGIRKRKGKKGQKEGSSNV